MLQTRGAFARADQFKTRNGLFERHTQFEKMPVVPAEFIVHKLCGVFCCYDGVNGNAAENDRGHDDDRKRARNSALNRLAKLEHGFLPKALAFRPAKIFNIYSTQNFFGKDGGKQNEL